MKEAIQKIKSLEEGTEINLVLSGGAVKGAAHLPLLELIEQQGLKIKAISGTSVGALVAAFYASGNSPKQILQIFKETPLFKYSWMKPRSSGVFNSMKYQKYFDGKMKKTFEELKVPLTVCATNMNTAEPIYFEEGELWDKVIASCAVPGIFATVTINDQVYSDGAVMDNFPVHPFLDRPEPIIGSLLTIPDKVENKKLRSAGKVLKRAIYLQKHAIETHKFNATYATVYHDLMKFSAFKQSGIQKIYDVATQQIFK